MPFPPAPLQESIGILLLLKAFAGGSVALTGVEAIANGVPAFKPPEAKNAANTMTAMAVLLGILFIGLTLFAVQYDLRPTLEGGPSIVALAAETAFGKGSALFVIFAASTALILFLAANTSFNAFPRLAAILAEDGYMPRQFSFRGDRLAYSWGIVLLAAIAFFLLWAFGGDTHSLIPLYSVGVFVCFTLSQIGMVRHWRRERDQGWRWRAIVNAGGALLTAVVLGIVVYEKFWDGAWIVVILVPLLVGMMLFIHRQYTLSRLELAVRPDLVFEGLRREERVVVPIPGVTRAVIQAINVARSIDDDVRAVYITEQPETAAQVRADFERQIPGVPLVVVESPYRRAGRAAAGVPRRPRCRLAAGPGAADHVRRDPGIRGPALVGADPVQPGGQAAARRPARPAVDRRRQRPVPARGSRAVRPGDGRQARAGLRADRGDRAGRAPVVS